MRAQNASVSAWPSPLVYLRPQHVFLFSSRRTDLVLHVAILCLTETLRLDGKLSERDYARNDSSRGEVCLA